MIVSLLLFFISCHCCVFCLSVVSPYDSPDLRPDLGKAVMVIATGEDRDLTLTQGPDLDHITLDPDPVQDPDTGQGHHTIEPSGPGLDLGHAPPTIIPDRDAVPVTAIIDWLFLSNCPIGRSIWYLFSKFAVCWPLLTNILINVHIVDWAWNGYNKFGNSNIDWPLML